MDNWRATIPCSVEVLAEHGVKEIQRRLHLGARISGLTSADEWSRFVRAARLMASVRSTLHLQDVRELCLGSTYKTAAPCLERLVQLMSDSRFDPVPQSIYDLAVASNYEFAIPMKMNSEKFDSSAMTYYFNCKGRKGKYFDGIHDIPDFARFVFVFAHGTKVVESTEYFWARKLDIVLAVAWQRLKPFTSRLLSQVLKIPATGPPPSAKDTLVPKSAVDHLQQDPSTSSSFVVAPDLQASFVAPVAHHGIPRITLEDAVARQGYMRSLFTKTTIAEPFFDRVVVIYRDKGPQGATRPFTLKEYEDVPFGDLEVVFPHRKLGMLPSDQMRMLAWLAMMVIFLFAAVREMIDGDVVGQDAASIGWMSLFIIAGVAARLVSGVVAYMNTMFYYEASINSWLSKRRLARDAALVAKLADEAAQQAAKENILAVLVVVMAGGSCTTQSLKAQAEAIIFNATKTHTVFDVDAAVKRLQQWKIVADSGDSSSRVVLAQESIGGWCDAFDIEGIVTAVNHD